MITTAFPVSAKLEFLQGIHAPSDSYRIALYTAEAKLDQGTTNYTTLYEVGGAGYRAGGMVLSGFKVWENKGTGILTFSDAKWENASISAEGLLIYNASKDNRAIAVFSFEETVTSTNSDFVVKMPDEGLIRLI